MSDEKKRPAVLVVGDEYGTGHMAALIARVLEEEKRGLGVVYMTGDILHEHKPLPRDVLLPFPPFSPESLDLGDDGPRATWKPEVGKMFCGHGPGARFIPDGKGGGTLTFTEHRKGFRPRARCITKKPRTA